MDALAIISVFLALFFLGLGLKDIYGYLMERKRVVTHVQTQTTGERFTMTKNRRKLSEKLFERISNYADDFTGLGQRINFFSEPHEVEALLQKAGWTKRITIEKFQGLKMFFTFAGLFFGIILFMLGFPFSQYLIIFLPLLGYLGTILWIKNAAKTRQEQLRFDLPDFLDTVSVTLQSGGGLDQTLREVIHYFDGPLREEFSRFNQEIELGVPREQAYRDLLKRNDNEEFQMLIKSLIQGMNLGVPVATTFKLQAEDLRSLRKEQAKEKAAKAAPKITLITTFIVAPTVIMMIAGLMILNMFFGENNLFDLL
ncbi:type II secretion system F family protein [Halalkalibacter urbisdiaboli]|uniref:type II secretion system F family protein n=1 Tax=Halalkalibacter urbisdiaboli TaxID=1960589 RepID=UPI000B44756A|nr:type II secretion system F family protein [Halalkalibacter urbisdiaboli]